MKNRILKNGFKTILGLILFTITTGIFALQANTNLVLEKLSENGNNVVIAVNIENPSNQNIASVQSWLEFNDKMKCASINTDDSGFDFVVPGESNVSGNIIKIGRSSLSGDVSGSKINVAKISCEILKQGAEIKFHDYKTDGGKVSVMVFENGFPVNTLKGKPEALRFEGIESKMKSNEESNVNFNTNKNIDNTKDVKYIERPMGLKIDTKIGSATLAWKGVKGAGKYYIYYGKFSGRYLQRRLVPSNLIYNLDGLETGVQYYFAVTAIGAGGSESDYSNEEAVIIGKKISSTSPLYKNTKNTKITKTISRKVVYKNNNVVKNNYLNSRIQNKNIAKNVQTGPRETAIVSIIVALALGLFIYRRKYI